MEHVNLFFLFVCFWLLSTTSQNFTFAHEFVSMDFFLLSPTTCCGSGRAVLCPPVSTCRGPRLPPATEKILSLLPPVAKPLPGANCVAQVTASAAAWTVMRPEHLVRKRKRSYQSKVRNSESLREGMPASTPFWFSFAPVTQESILGFLGMSLP